MKRTIIIAADDFGLTRGITDTILETVDRGPVTRVSIIPNGEAVAYAMEEYTRRSPHLSLAVHLNLTEGKALSAASDVPLLVDTYGYFKYGVTGLWGAYLIAGSSRKSRFREQVRCEIEAQLAHIRGMSDVREVVVNGHQHVHLIPFVFDTLLTLPDIAEIRTIREPFQWSWSLTQLLARSVLEALSNRAVLSLHIHGIGTNDSFVGFVHSGHMTLKTLRTGLLGAKGSVEVLLHPGSATRDELSIWKGSRADVLWHYSPWRTKERGLLLDPHFLASIT